MRTRISSLVLALFGIQTLITLAAAAQRNSKLRGAACIEITDASISGILHNLNAERASVQAAGMPLVTWNTSVQHQLEQCRQSVGSAFFFSTYSGNVRNTLNSSPYQGTHLIDDKPLAGLPAACDFSTLAKDGWAYLWRDTGQCTTAGQGSMQYNFHFRMEGQAKCFKYANCDANKFHSYMTCNSTKVVLTGGTPCSWFWQYVARGLMDHLYQIAGVRIPVHGPNAPGNQPASYFMYGRYLPGVLPAPLNDQPYVEGKPGSACPDQFSAQLARIGPSKHVMCVQQA